MDQEGEKRNVGHENRLASIGELTAGILHEVNGHISYMLFNLEYLESLAMHDEAREALHAIREGTEAVRQLSKSVTLLARGSERRDSVIDLSEVVRAALRIAGPRTRAVATLSEEIGTAPPVRGDVVQILQVVVNLLLNAADACEEGSSARPTILVRLETSPQGRRQSR
jgi:C4-dicarboxylate-specific signal transduction histidine kinase